LEYYIFVLKSILSKLYIIAYINTCRSVLSGAPQKNDKEPENPDQESGVNDFEKAIIQWTCPKPVLLILIAG
jgi:hypothetical protein